MRPLLLSLLAVGLASAADRVLFDFESGTFQGWTYEGGKAFGDAPFKASGEVETWAPLRQFRGWQGQYMVIVGDTRHGRTPPGKLISDEFAIDQPYLNFWFGAELHPQIRIQLRVGSREVRTAYGNNSYDMRLRGFDVREFRGKRARLVMECASDLHALFRADHFYLSDAPPPARHAPNAQESEVLRTGDYRLLLDPGPGQIIYYSDLVQGPDRRWHIFASISGPSDLYKPQNLKRIVHASAPALSGPWQNHGVVLTADPAQGEDFLQDPAVVVHEGEFYLYTVASGKPWKGWDKNYQWRIKNFGPGSTQGPYGIHLFRSKDGQSWTRHGKDPLFTDNPFAFTPAIRRVRGEWTMYYAAAEPALISGKHAIVSRTSKDLVRWDNRRVVLADTTDTTPWPEHSFFRSPEVFERDGRWWLLAGCIDNGNQARFHYLRLFSSSDPHSFDLNRHHKGIFVEGGARIVRDNDGRMYITSGGPYSRGVWLAPLEFTPPAPAASAIRDRWWESVPAMKRLALNEWPDWNTLPLEPKALDAALDKIIAEGFGAIEIFAPFEGGKSYHGLDAKDRYRIDPKLGTMDDFRRLVRQAHAKGLAVVSFDNLGYSSVDAPHWLRAQDAVKEGKRSREREWFRWADDEKAPPPPGDSFYNIPGQAGRWAFSERAGKFYWSKWGGVDSQGKRVRLPQYDWSEEAWQTEAASVVRHWMDTGIDGMIIDAVNWYPGYTWEIGKQRILNVINSYGSKFSQPEGAGGFREDPVAWITEGGWNCVQDYGLGIWWEKANDTLKNSIEAGDPRPVEAALRAYHDRVVAAGGVLYASPSPLPTIEKHRLSVAVIATIGDMLISEGGARKVATEDEAIRWLLRTKRDHAALHQPSRRRLLPVAEPAKHWAFLKTSQDAEDRVLVVTNFQPEAQTVTVDLAGVACRKLTDLASNETMEHASKIQVALPAFGYRLFLIR